MKSDELLSVLVAARPDLMRNSLVSYLRTISGITILPPMDDASSTLQAVRALRPDVVVADVNLSETSVLSLVQQLRKEPSKPNCIVLADSVQQKKLFNTAGASSVLLKGFLDERLKEAVLRIQPNDKPPVASDAFRALNLPPLPPLPKPG